MRKYEPIGVLAMCIAVAGSAVSAGWQDMLKGAGDSLKGGGGSDIAGLTDTEMNGGLKEALAVGAERAIEGLSRPGGYLNDPAVRIPLPGALEKTEKVLRMMGQDEPVSLRSMIARCSINHLRHSCNAAN